MKSIYRLTLLLFAIILIGCAREELSIDQAEKLIPEVPSDVQTAIDEAMAELEQDYNHPPVEEHIGTRATVHVPAGSVDALAAAIQAAGWGGKVILESGDHWESNTVMIEHTVRIIGEDGAKLYVNAGDAFDVNAAGQTVTKAGIYIKNAHAVRIENLDIRPSNGSGSMGIFLERGLRARIQNNKFSNFQLPVWLSDLSNMVSIYDNEFDGGGITAWGITVESGKSVKIKGNYLTNSVVGIFMSDERGIATDNEVTLGTIGFLLCTVQGSYDKPNGETLTPAISCTKARVINNDCHNNYWNYLVIDGTNNSVLFNNKAANAGLYDVELAGITDRFGTMVPTSANNFVINTDNNIITKDCGVDNTVLGGTMVNNAADPCFKKSIRKGLFQSQAI